MKAISKNNVLLVGVCVAILATAFLMFQTQHAFGSITDEQPVTEPKLLTYTFFATSTNQTVYATTTTATSTNITSWFDNNGRLVNGAFNVKGARKVVLYFTRGDKLGGGNTGSTTFRVQASPDGTNWYYYDRFVNATSTGSLSTITLSGTSTLIAAMDLDYSAFTFIRAIAVETTDGSHELKAQAEF